MAYDTSRDILYLCQKRAYLVIERSPFYSLKFSKQGFYLPSHITYTPPVGLAGKDIFPWSYNRELSYLRRPVIRYQYDDGTVMCME